MAVPILAIIENVSGIGLWWLKGSRGRARRGLNELKRRKEKLMKRPASVKLSRRLEKIEYLIKKLQEYLGEE